MDKLQSTRGQTVCKVCSVNTWHAEVLLAYPTRNLQGEVVTRFKRDWACIRCYHTLENGPLPMETSDTFCIIADNLHVKSPSVNLPFGNK